MASDRRSHVVLLTLVLLLMLVEGCRNSKKAQTDAGNAGDVGDVGQTAAKPAHPAAAKVARTVAHKGPVVRNASSHHTGTITSLPPLDVSNLLTQADVHRVTHYEGPVVLDHLAGQTPSPNYNSILWRPATRGHYGVGVQVWKVANAHAAHRRLMSWKKQYLNVQPIPTNLHTPTGAFVADRAGIRSYVFADSRPPSVVAITCADTVCATWKPLVTLGTRVMAHLH